MNDSMNEDGEKIVIAPKKSKTQEVPKQSTDASNNKDIPDVSVKRNGVSENQNLNMDMTDPKTLELLKKMKAASPLERREMYGKLQEMSVLKGFPTIEELRKDGENSFHALDGKNPINIRAKKVKLIRDVDGSAIEVHFKEYVEKAHSEIRIEKGFEKPDEIKRKIQARNQGQYEED